MAGSNEIVSSLNPSDIKILAHKELKNKGNPIAVSTVCITQEGYVFIGGSEGEFQVYKPDNQSFTLVSSHTYKDVDTIRSAVCGIYLGTDNTVTMWQRNGKIRVFSTKDLDKKRGPKEILSGQIFGTLRSVKGSASGIHALVTPSIYSPSAYGGEIVSILHQRGRLRRPSTTRRSIDLSEYYDGAMIFDGDISEDGNKTAVTITGSRAITFSDTGEGFKQQGNMYLDYADHRQVKISSDGNRIAFVTGQGVKVFEYPFILDKPVISFAREIESTSTVVFSQGLGKAYIPGGSHDGGAYYDASIVSLSETNPAVANILRVTYPAAPLAFSPDSTRIVRGNVLGDLYLLGS